MTILGLHASHDHALLWADSQLYFHGEPSGHACKVALNGSAVIVGASAGNRGMALAAEEALLAATSLDECLITLPRVLTAVAVRRARDCIYVACGRRRRSLAGFLFEGPSYQPRPIRSFTMPRAAEVASCNPQDPADAIDVAQGQLVALRREFPEATGTLTVVALSPGGVRARLSFDLTRGIGARLPLEAAA